jgi:hypothetical protein
MANAQPVETLTLSIVWEKPLIQFGETNTGKIYATLGPEICTLTAWNSPPGSGQLGVLKAFATTIFDFKNVQNATKGSLWWTFNPEFELQSSWATSDGEGGFAGASPGQIGAKINPDPNIDQAVWLIPVPSPSAFRRSAHRPQLHV